MLDEVRLVVHYLRAELWLLALLATATFALGRWLMQDFESFLFFLTLLQLVAQLLLEALVGRCVDGIAIMRLRHDVLGDVVFDGARFVLIS